MASNFQALAGLSGSASWLRPRRSARLVEEQALKRAELESLYAEQLRTRKAVIVTRSDGEPQVVELRNLKPEARDALINQVLTGEGGEKEAKVVLTKIRERLDKVGLDFHNVTVRWRNLTMVGQVQVKEDEEEGGGARHGLVEAVGEACLSARSAVTGVPPPGSKELRILDGMSGVLRPQRLALLLGPPGSGKTTLLRALAGQNLRDKSLKVSCDELTYNGRSMDQFVVESTAIYVSQVDEHMGELTVRETLDFAARCLISRSGEERINLVEQKEAELGIEPDPAFAAYMQQLIKSRRENIMTLHMLAMLGLDVCADTIVGNEMLRGVSGGQKKRVTTGEMSVGPHRVMFADEISTGLDSATTYDIVKGMRDMCHYLHGTMMVSLLQPAPETFELFEDVFVISAGRLVYQGPPNGVLGFFESLGFACPRLKGVADFVQEVTTAADQQRFWGSNGPHQYLSAGQMAAAFAATPAGAAIAAELLQPYQSPPDRQGPGVTMYKYGQGWPVLLRANLRRQLILQKRSIPFVVLRLFQRTLMGFAVGTLFLNTEKQSIEDAQLFQGVMFQSVMCTLTAAFSSSAQFMNRLPVYFRQRDAGFYPGWAFLLPEVLMQVPIIFAECWLWTLLVYFCVGFYTSARVLVFFGVLFVSGIWGSTLFIALAAITCNHTIAASIQSFLMLLFLISSGFIANPMQMPAAWLGAYYANPTAWFTKALAINEMTSPDWSDPVVVNGTNTGVTIGEAALASRDFPTTYNIVWYALFAWGLGATAVNLVACIAACSYLTMPRGARAVSLEDVRERSRDDAAAVQAGTAAAAAGGAAGGSGKGAGGCGGSADQGAVNDKGTDGKLLSDSPVNTPTAVPVSGKLVPPTNAAGSPGTDGKGDIEEGGSFAKPVAGLDNAGSKDGGSGSTLPFRPLSMAFKDVRYSVPFPEGASKEGAQSEGPHAGQLLLLKGISGSFRPRVLTALMGASGAGKTTLMDVLAGRKTGGTITGEIMINGFPQRMETFNRVMGYVEQTDVHIAESTVLESLMFSARLRLPCDVPADVVKSFVYEVLGLVELTGIRNALVGRAGQSGLSVEQRKRLTIAVELVANPSIVFMDEPTSGLDARAAAVVMRAVRNTVSTGRTVVCTIHQPSLEIFLAFDELLLLKRGGETIFNGPIGADASRLTAYFSAFDGVPPIKPGYNPANWMLEVTSHEAEKKAGTNFAERYAQSELARASDALVEELSRPRVGEADLNLADLRVASGWAQGRELLRRNWQQYKRENSYNAVRVFVTLVIGLCFGTLFQNQGTSLDSFAGIINVAGALYMSVLFLGILDCMMVQDIIVHRRQVYYREHAAGMYSVAPYISAEFLVEVPYIAAQATVYSLLTYWMIGFEADAGKFFWFLMVMFLTLGYWVFFGVLTVHITPAHEMAMALAGFLISFLNLFCGFLKPRPKIPAGWIWFYWCNPLAYTLYALISEQLGASAVPLQQPVSPTVTTVGEFITYYFGYSYSFRWWAVGILCLFVAFFCACSTLALKRCRWQNR